MHRACTFLGTLLLVGLLAAAGVQQHQADTKPDMAETLARAAEYRQSVVPGLQGTFLCHYFTSQRHNAAYQRILAQDAARRQQKETVEIPPLGSSQALLVDFAYDHERHRWRYEVVALNNTGYDWIGISALAADKRELDPSAFYLLSVCDGETVHEYDRSVNMGYVRDAGPGQDPDLLQNMWRRVAVGLEDGVVQAIEAGDAKVIDMGEEAVDDRPSRRLRVQRSWPDGSTLLAFLWIDPRRAHATVRQELLTLGPDRKLRSLKVVSASNFAELVPGFWCPQRVQTDRFYYQKRPEEDQYAGDDPWWFTSVIDWSYSQSPDDWPHGLRAQTPLDIRIPLFPFDARVQDETVAAQGRRVRASPARAARLILDRLLPDVQPDPVGAALVDDAEVLRRIEGGQ